MVSLIRIFNKKISYLSRWLKIINMDRRELKNECTLQEVAENVEGSDHALFFGVIIDITEPFKYEDNDNYTT